MNKYKNIFKTTIQILGFTHRRIMGFPELTIFKSDCIVTETFSKDIYRLSRTKLYLHYSYVTGEIYGLTYNFCNWKVRENKQIFICFAHYLFGFGFYFLVKGVCSSVWGEKILVSVVKFK